MRLTLARKRRRRSSPALLAIALVVSATVIWKASFASFAVTTSNPGNAWDTGKLVLRAENGAGASVTGSAVFTVNDLRPGDAIADKCITVAYTGDITAGAAVRLYATGVVNATAVNAHSLSTYLSLVIDEATTNATNTTCTTFANTGAPLFDTTHNQAAAPTAIITAGSVKDFMTNRTDYTSGLVTSWTPTPTSSKSYRFRVAFPGSATFPGGGSNTIDSDLMDMTATVTFTWEVRS